MNRLKKERFISFRDLTPFLVAAGLHLGACVSRPFADAYAIHVYPIVSWGYVALTGWIPFSVAETLLVGLGVLYLALLGRDLRKVRRGEERLRAMLLRRTRRAVVEIGVIYLLFAVWGVNYQRTPLARFAGFDTSRADTSELRALADELVDETNALRGATEEDAEGVMRLGSSRGEALSRARLGFGPAAELEPDLFRGRAGRAKGLRLLATPMSFVGADGIFLMWTGEPSVNLNVPDPALAFNACHEIAHQVGWAREQEANFVGYLACANHPDLDFRYSGSAAALRHVLRALERVDAESARSLRDRLDPGVVRDWEALAAYSRRYRGRVRDLSGPMYDSYLKSQGQKEGRASYGKVVDLLLAYRKTKRGT